MLYGFVATQRPQVYMEIGSGNSTKFACRAIRDHGLDTRVVSIDPCPRAEVEALCDEAIRCPVEEVDLTAHSTVWVRTTFDSVDNSHRALMNSDATAVLMDVIPRLKAGVLVESHDITLPCDDRTERIERWCSEQYLLAAYVLARGSLFRHRLAEWLRKSPMTH